MSGAGPSSLVLVAGANPSSWHRVKAALSGSLTVAFSVDLPGTLDVLQRHRPAALVLSSRLLDASVEQAIQRVREQDSAVPVLLLTREEQAEPSAERADACLDEQRIADCLLAVLQNLLRRGRPAGAGAARELEADGGMVLGRSPAMVKLMQIARRVATIDVDVLITGETGTGKEVLARWLHGASCRSARPFVPVDLPAIPETLFESILFGHERGSFTGAVSPHQGKFQRAEGGTLFLDEISSLKLELQPKLLRAIQGREIESVGAAGPTPCDVRVVAASNEDLGRAVKRGAFRADLFHRLQVIVLALPPLRERREDIPELVRFLVRRHAERFELPAPLVATETMRALQGHSWPGNIRELEHCVQRAILLSQGGYLELEHLLPPAGAQAGDEAAFGDCSWSLAEMEQRYIERVMELTEGNQSRAAQLLQIDRKTLRAKLQRYAEQPGVLQSVS